jgi:hypothetical protein
VSGGWQLAQLNVARMRGAADSEVMASFMAQLAEVNAVADAAPGFVWRLQSAEGDATSIHAFDDDRILVNMSVWESLQALRDYAYAGRHLDVLRNRREWFEGYGGPYVVLWWVPAGHTPTVEEAKQRLALLEEQGPTAEAFSFQQSFEAPSEVGAAAD